MKWLDSFLQDRRISRAARFINPGSVVLDIGSDDGVLFRKIKNIKSGIGIEPKLEKDITGENYTILKGNFPAACPPGTSFDAITMLAVLEHIPLAEQQKIALAACEVLTDDGIIIITVPSASVDMILSVLKKLHLVDGMSLEEHYGFNVVDTEKIFAPPHFKLVTHQKFQLGLNNIFVFSKTPGPSR